MVIAGVTRLFLIRRDLVDIQFLHILKLTPTLNFHEIYLWAHQLTMKSLVTTLPTAGACGCPRSRCTPVW